MDGKLMAEDAKLAIDESNRAAQYEEDKGEARREVREKIVQSAQVSGDDGRAEAMGSRLREKSIQEIASTETEIERARFAARLSQVVDYVFGVIYALIGLEIVLELLGARES